MSSISGSESDSEEEGTDNDFNANGPDSMRSPESSLITGRPSTKIVFQNSAGEYLSVYRCILQGKAKQVQYNTMSAPLTYITAFFVF